MNLVSLKSLTPEKMCTACWLPGDALLGWRLRRGFRLAHRLVDTGLCANAVSPGFRVSPGSSRVSPACRARFVCRFCVPQVLLCVPWVSPSLRCVCPRVFGVARRYCGTREATLQGSPGSGWLRQTPSAIRAA